jgi:hypothetical protein
LTTFNTDELLGQGIPLPMIAFMEWLTEQDAETLTTALACVYVLDAFESGRLSIITPFGALPNVWGAEKAATDLRDMARSAGYPDAALLIEETRLEAVSGRLAIESVLGMGSGSEKGGHGVYGF